jgi:hypothetical protein
MNQGWLSLRFTTYLPPLPTGPLPTGRQAVPTEGGAGRPVRRSLLTSVALA